MREIVRSVWVEIVRSVWGEIGGPTVILVDKIEGEEPSSNFNDYSARIHFNSFNDYVAMSLNALVRLPLSTSKLHEDALLRHSLFSTRTMQKPERRNRHAFVVEAKGKKGMQARRFQRAAPPPLPKIEDDGNPKFVIFIRMANVCSLSFLLFSSGCFYRFIFILPLWNWC